MAHADATDSFDANVEIEVTDDSSRFVENKCAALCLATGTESDADNGNRVRAGDHVGVPRAGNCVAAPMLKIIENVWHGLPRDVSVSDAVDLYHRCKCATTEAGDFLNGELPKRVGVGIVGNVQFLMKRLENVVGTFDVTSGAGANANGVFACRFVSELIVKGRNRKEIGRRDVGFFADFVQDFLGKVSVFFLNALQDRNERTFLATVFSENV